jgi:hypothetical protein
MEVKMSRFVLISLLAGTLAMLGCASDNQTPGTGGTGGTGGTSGTGGTGGTGGTAGLGGTSGGDVRAGLYKGTMGNPFADNGIGWAVCFYVNRARTELNVAKPCDVSFIYDPSDTTNDDANAFEIEVAKSDCNFKIDYNDIQTFGPVPISPDGEFAKTFKPSSSEEQSFSGVINGTTARGTAQQRDLKGPSGSLCQTDWSATLEQP